MITRNLHIRPAVVESAHPQVGRLAVMAYSVHWNWTTLPRRQLHRSIALRVAPLLSTHAASSTTIKSKRSSTLRNTTVVVFIDTCHTRPLRTQTLTRAAAVIIFNACG